MRNRCALSVLTASFLSFSCALAGAGERSGNVLDRLDSQISTFAERIVAIRGTVVDIIPGAWIAEEDGSLMSAAVMVDISASKPDQPSRVCVLGYIYLFFEGSELARAFTSEPSVSWAFTVGDKFIGTLVPMGGRFDDLEGSTVADENIFQVLWVGFEGDDGALLEQVGYSIDEELTGGVTKTASASDLSAAYRKKLQDTNVSAERVWTFIVERFDD